MAFPSDESARRAPDARRRRRLIEACQVRIHSRSKHIGEHTNRCPVALNPAPESRMAIAIRIFGNTLPNELLRNMAASWGSVGSPLIKEFFLGQGLPDRLVPQRGQMIEHVVKMRWPSDRSSSQSCGSSDSSSASLSSKFVVSRSKQISYPR
jgi:hypothetical protein